MVNRFLLAAAALLGFAGGALAQEPAPVSGAPDSDTAWEAAVNAFALADREHAPPPGGVVFVGSSSIRLWQGLEQQFPSGGTVIKRGFGGSRLSDCVRYLNRLVIPYRPRLVLVYAGDNDLAEGRTPQEVLRQFEAFAQGIHRALPETRVAFISVKPSPARAHIIAKARAANALVHRYTASQEWLDYIDVFTPMLGPDGNPRKELFRADALHLNAAGYALWKTAITPHLR
jgi:lysophospholipase L1-like esterase